MVIRIKDSAPEMQKAAVAADISVLFFSAGANFWAILGHFWAIFWQNMHMCYLNRFLQLCTAPAGEVHFKTVQTATNAQLHKRGPSVGNGNPNLASPPCVGAL